MLLIISILLAAALIAVVAVIIVKNTGDDANAADSAKPAPGCIDENLRITADPVVADAISDILAAVDDCEAPSITAEPSAVTAASLGAGDAADFDIWIPDSEMWAAYVSGQRSEAGASSSPIVVGETIGSSPVVFAATATTAAALGSADAGFATLAASAGTGLSAVYLPDPMTVSSSSGALLAAQVALAGDARTFTGLILGLTKKTATASDALDDTAASAAPSLAVTTEEALLSYNDGVDESARLTAIYPADAQPAAAIPLVLPADAPESTINASEALVRAIAADPTTLAQHGLRDAEGALEGSELPVVPPADSTNQYEVLKTWRVLTAPSRMLALSDVSGSMSQPAGKDTTRIDLFSEAAVRAINSMSAESSMSIRIFSSRRIGAQDWQEIVPFGPLGDPGHKKLAIDTAQNLEGYVGGGTGLYDSVLDALKYMQETYVEGEINLVLLNTDGYNEDDDGLDLAGLLAEIEKIHDPSRPVPVIAVGYGPDTDQEALEKIAAATDGAAYQALEPTDISTVLVDAVTQRGCRPYCG